MPTQKGLHMKKLIFIIATLFVGSPIAAMRVPGIVRAARGQTLARALLARSYATASADASSNQGVSKVPDLFEEIDTTLVERQKHLRAAVAALGDAMHHLKKADIEFGKFKTLMDKNEIFKCFIPGGISVPWMEIYVKSHSRKIMLSESLSILKAQIIREIKLANQEMEWDENRKQGEETRIAKIVRELHEDGYFDKGGPWDSIKV